VRELVVDIDNEFDSRRDTMVEINKAKSQKPNVELVNAEKLKSMVNQVKVDPSDIELRLCDPFYKNHLQFERCLPFDEVLKHCHPILEICVPHIPGICTPSVVIPGKPDLEDLRDTVINPPRPIDSSEELISAVKALTNEVQELKKKIGKN
jgi:hypothetical protein